MLRLFLLSDTHFEFCRDEPLLRPPLKIDFDVLVISDDTGTTGYLLVDV
ncbi:MAG: hypothetical protein RLN85_00620 [Pseudomonadales bacterium]